MLTVRSARTDDLALLPVIERAAGGAFRSLAMDAVADDGPPTPDELGAYLRAGRVFVAEQDGRVVGYLLLDPLAGAAHIEQVSVHPDAAGRRVGSRLVDAAEHWARERGLRSLTLTCYARVPWNAPYYARLGFAAIPEAELPPELAAVRRAEKARGLDDWPRVAMRRRVPPAG